MTKKQAFKLKQLIFRYAVALEYYTSNPTYREKYVEAKNELERYIESLIKKGKKINEKM